MVIVWKYKQIKVLGGEYQRCLSLEKVHLIIVILNLHTRVICYTLGVSRRVLYNMCIRVNARVCMFTGVERLSRITAALEKGSDNKGSEFQ